MRHLKIGKSVAATVAATLLSAAAADLACAADTAPAVSSVAVTDSEGTVYDRDYPFMHYSDPPVRNRVARLQRQLDAGTVHLARSPQHGYLDSLLQALDISPESQTLVFSKTSLQIDAISPVTPRALYFNDDTYVGWVQKTGIMEVVTMDADRGPVFYSISAADPSPRLSREALRCLSCHDSYAELGGGVPRFLFESTYDVQGQKLIPDGVARETSEETPIAQRWGGWYVTGSDGGAVHLGNIVLPASAPAVDVAKVKRGSLASLDSLVDTSPYLRNTSDIVALLVLEHQVTVHGQIVHANYKVRSVLSTVQPDCDPANCHWAQLTARLQTRFDLMLRPLVDALLLANAAPLPARMAGSAAYAAVFQAQGPKDPQGRSLHELDLNSRVFRYPLSYLIYSEGFDALPLCVRERVYARLAQILQDPAPAAPYSSRTPAERRAAFEILVATKPDFAQAAGALRD